MANTIDIYGDETVFGGLVARNFSGPFEDDVVTFIGDYVFYTCSLITEIYFPSVSQIGSNAFAACSSLVSVDFPALTSIAIYAFAYCVSLNTANFPSAEIIDGRAFQSCRALTSVSIPVASSVGTNAFVGCSRLTSITLPAVTNISNYAFSGCFSLASVYITGSSVCALYNKNAFANTPMSVSGYLGYFGSIYVPSSLVDAYKSATNWANYSNRITAIVE